MKIQQLKIKDDNKDDICFEVLKDALYSSDTSNIGYSIPDAHDVTKIGYGRCGQDFILIALNFIQNPAIKECYSSKYYIFRDGKWVYEFSPHVCMDFEFFNNMLIEIHTDGIYFTNHFAQLTTENNRFITAYYSSIPFDNEKYVDMTIIGDSLYILTDKRLITISIPDNDVVESDNVYISKSLNFSSEMIPPSGIIRNATGNDVILYGNNNGLIPFYYKVNGESIYSFVDELEYDVVSAIIFNDILCIYCSDNRIRYISSISKYEKPAFTNFNTYDGHMWIGNVKFLEGKIWTQYLITSTNSNPQIVYANSINGLDFVPYEIRKLNFSDVIDRNNYTLPLDIESTPYGLFISNGQIERIQRNYEFFGVYPTKHIELTPSKVKQIQQNEFAVYIDINDLDISDVDDIDVEINNLSNSVGFVPIVTNVYINQIDNKRYLIIKVTDPLNIIESFGLRNKPSPDINQCKDIKIKLCYKIYA